MKMYFEKNNARTGYTPCGRYQKIYYNGNGEPYFLRGGRREKFDDMPRLYYPVMVEDADGKLIVISGYIPLSNTCCLFVEVHPDGEMVRLWREIEL